MKGYGLRKVTRTGKSLTVTLPYQFTKQHGIKKGDNILVVINNGYLKVVPVK